MLCFLLLLTYHASRDALITALPTIAHCTNKPNTSYLHRAYAVGSSPLRLSSSPLSSATRLLFSPGGHSPNGPGRNIGDSDGIAEQDGHPIPMTIILKSKDGKFIFDHIAEDILAYQKHLDGLNHPVNLDEDGLDENGYQVQRRTRQQPRLENELYSSGGWLPRAYSLDREDVINDDNTDQCTDYEFGFGSLQYKVISELHI